MRLLIYFLALPISVSIVKAQQTDSERDILNTEKELILKMIDSLENRLDEINFELTKNDPEERLQVLVEKYGKNKGKLIAQGKVWQSISYEMAIDSWGKPTEIKKTETQSGETQKWIYPNNKYLYFKNGRLESWKE